MDTPSLSSRGAPSRGVSGRPIEFADVRYAGVVLPVIGWWLYDIFYITPFLAIPYLHTVNREIFSD